MASYRFGVMWIALNDEPMEMDSGVVKTFISTALLADLFGKETEEVAVDIVKYKLRNAGEAKKTDRQLDAIESEKEIRRDAGKWLARGGR